MQFGIISSLVIYLAPPILLLLNYKLQSKYIRYAFFVYVFLLLALSYNIPTDYQRYCNIVEMTDVLKFSLTNEPVQRTLAYIANMSGQIRVFFVLNAFITSILSFLLYRQYRDKKYVDLLLFLSYFTVILISFAAVRNGVAIGISLLAFKYLFEKKKYSLLIYFGLILLAMLSHTSAVLLIVLPLLLPTYKFIKKKFKHPITIISPILIAMLPLIMGILKLLTRDYGFIPKYYSYVSDFTNNTVTWVWIGLGVLVTVLAYGFDRVLAKEKENDRFTVSIIASWLGLFTLLLLPGTLIRVCIWFFAFSIFACARVFQLKDLKVKLYMSLFILFVVFALSTIGVSGPVKAFPYNTDNSVIWHSDHSTDFKLKFID